MLRLLTVGVIPEVSPWVGTTVGGAVISGAAGNWSQVAVGSLVVAIGLLPLIVRSAFASRAQRQDDILDARERLVAEFVADFMHDAADIELAARPGRVTQASESIEALLDDVYTRVFGGDPDVRVVLYRISDDEKRLAPQRTCGRRGEPREFETSDERGAIAIRRLGEPDEYTFVEDAAASPESWGAANRSYETFIALPIRSSEVAFGMLTVDSSRPHSLTDRDAQMLVAVAATLAWLFALMERGRRSPRRWPSAGTVVAQEEVSDDDDSVDPGDDEGSEEAP